MVPIQTAKFLITYLANNTVFYTSHQMNAMTTVYCIYSIYYLCKFKCTYRLTREGGICKLFSRDKFRCFHFDGC